MSHLDIIRAWKDEDYWLSLDESERALLPANPAGLVELTDADLDQAAGGLAGDDQIPIAFCCIVSLCEKTCVSPSAIVGGEKDTKFDFAF